MCCTTKTTNFLTSPLMHFPNLAMSMRTNSKDQGDNQAKSAFYIPGISHHIIILVGADSNKKSSTIWDFSLLTKYGHFCFEICVHCISCYLRSWSISLSGLFPHFAFVCLLLEVWVSTHVRPLVGRLARFSANSKDGLPFDKAQRAICIFQLRAIGA